MFQQLSSFSWRKGWVSTWNNFPQGRFLFYKLFNWKITEVNDFLTCLIILNIWKKKSFKLLADLSWKLKSFFIECLVFFNLYYTPALKPLPIRTYHQKSNKLRLKLVVLRSCKKKIYLIKKTTLVSLTQQLKEKKLDTYIVCMCKRLYIERFLSIVSYNVRFWFNSKLLSLVIQLYLIKNLPLNFIISTISNRLLLWRRIKPAIKILLTSFGFFQYKLIGFFLRFSGKFGVTKRSRLAKLKLIHYGKLAKKDFNSLHDIYQLPTVTKYGVFGITVGLSYQLI